MKVTVAATQFACTPNAAENVARAESMVRQAAAKGAQVILLQELFETPYFCKDHLASHFAGAHPLPDNPLVRRFQALAKELGVVLPISVFERANNAYYNSLAMVDADGEVMGIYRKSHIPDGPGYHEKFYFSPGDTGFKVWQTRYGTIGVGICWDQWFPEAARCMALMGADILCIRPRSAPSRRTPASTRATLAALHAGPRRGQRHAAGRLEPHRRGAGREIRDDVLRLVLHRRQHRRQGRRGRRAPARRS